jgi:hypothetical protein
MPIDIIKPFLELLDKEAANPALANGAAHASPPAVPPLAA